MEEFGSGFSHLHTNHLHPRCLVFTITRTTRRAALPQWMPLACALTPGVTHGELFLFLDACTPAPTPTPTSYRPGPYSPRRNLLPIVFNLQTDSIYRLRCELRWGARFVFSVEASSQAAGNLSHPCSPGPIIHTSLFPNFSLRWALVLFYLCLVFTSSGRAYGVQG
jgi:hypothetical protein